MLPRQRFLKSIRSWIDQTGPCERSAPPAGPQQSRRSPKFVTLSMTDAATADLFLRTLRLRIDAARSFTTAIFMRTIARLKKRPLRNSHITASARTPILAGWLDG